MVGIEIADHGEIGCGDKGGLQGAYDEDPDTTELVIVLHHLVELASVDVRAHEVLDKQVDGFTPQDGERRVRIGGIKVFITCTYQGEMKQVQDFHLGMQTEDLSHLNAFI